jgi:nucleoid-associated protein EbfC
MTKRRGGGFGGPMGGGAGGRGGMNDSLRQLQKMQEDMAKAQEALGTEVFEVQVGGIVTVKITGHQRVTAYQIDFDKLDLNDPEWKTDLADMLMVATNQAIEESQKRAAERMETISSGLDSLLPGGLGGLMGG